MITPDFAAYAVGADVHLHQHMPSEELVRRVEEIMTKIALECVRSGADLIGHIKCVVETKGKGFLAVSVSTSPAHRIPRGNWKMGSKRWN